MVELGDGLPKTKRIRTWVKSAHRHCPDKLLLTRAMLGLKWEPLPCPMSVIGSLAVCVLKRQGGIGEISHVAESHALEPSWLVGIRTPYPEGVAQIYALVIEGAVLPLANDFWPHVLH